MQCQPEPPIPPDILKAISCLTAWYILARRRCPSNQERKENQKHFEGFKTKLQDTVWWYMKQCHQKSAELMVHLFYDAKV